MAGENTKTLVIMIGIGGYEESTGKHDPKCDIDGKPIEYKPLQGPVFDVNNMEKYLISNMNVPKSHIKTLIAPWDTESTDETSEPPPSDSPTYDNILKAFAWVLEEANYGDLVYFFFAGHGARATTVFPHLKGKKGLDEALVPTDVNNGGKYLRDVEIALWLKKLVKKGLVVTTVLDCCYSGGATRAGSQARSRCIPETYRSVTTDKPSQKLLKELIAYGIGKVAHVAFEGALVKDQWLIEPQGYTLFAACLPSEDAKEIMVHGRYRGALTHWLLKVLKRAPKISTRDLCTRVSAKFRENRLRQTPYIGGTTDRVFFGTDVIPPAYYIRVENLSGRSMGQGANITLKAGMLHGIVKGSKYNVFDSKDNRMITSIAQVEVQKVNLQSSRAKLIELKNPESIQTRCKAVLLGLPSQNQCRVCLSQRMKDEGLAQPCEKALRKQDAWLRLVEEHDISQVNFRIDVNESNIEIQNRYGVVLPAHVQLPPQLSPADGSLGKLAYTLRHLYLFDTLKDISNPKESLGLSVRFELLGKSRDGTEDDSESNIAPIEEQDGEFLVKHKEPVFVRVKNESKYQIFFAIFDLQPGFGATQIYPTGSNAELLDAGSAIQKTIKMKVPKNFCEDSCVDTFKIFFMRKTVDLSVLTLPDLHDGASHKLRASSNDHTLKSLLDMLRVPNRNGRVSKADDWGTKMISIRTSKNDGS